MLVAFKPAIYSLTTPKIAAYPPAEFEQAYHDRQTCAEVVHASSPIP